MNELEKAALLRKIQAKIADIQAISLILSRIEQFLDSNIDTNEKCVLLSKIGFQSKILSFNDTDPDCIRNKYGYFNRSKALAIREDGINWENLATLFEIFNPINKEKNLEYQTLIEVAIKDFETDLIDLKNELARIISTEKEIVLKISLEDPELSEKLNLLKSKLRENPTPIAEQTKKPEVINKYVNRFTYYFSDRKNLEQIRNLSNPENQEIKRILESDLSIKKNRYKVARLLCLIGEASNEISQHLKQKNPMIPFKQLIQLRNDLAHAYHKIIIKLSSQDRALIDLQMLIRKDIPIDLLNAIDDTLKNYSQEPHQKNTLNDSSKEHWLWSQIREPEIIQSTPATPKKSDPAFERIKIFKNRLLREIIKNIREVKQDSPPDIQYFINQLVKDKQALEENPNSDEKNSEKIETYNLVISFLQNCKELPKNQLLNKIGLEVKSKDKSLSSEQSTTNLMPNLLAFISHMNQEFSDKTQLSDTDKLISLLEKINSEIHFLSESIQNREPNEDQFDIEHSLAIAGQIIRDLRSQKNLHTLFLEASSETSLESVFSKLVTYRNQELMHGITEITVSKLTNIVESIINAQEQIGKIIEKIKKADTQAELADTSHSEASNPSKDLEDSIHGSGSFRMK